MATGNVYEVYMQLTQYTDYSLRTLIYLAVHENGATIGTIADYYGISKNHLVKVAHHLSKLGYISTNRGRSGGIELNGDPGDINIGKVVSQVEPNFHLVECFNMEKNTCPITPVCMLSGVLGKAHREFMGVLDEYTLSDLIQNRKALTETPGVIRNA
jgi:Rrf2 family transcriptional regulator, nitric oxide-sensitive transcriptional repressor